MTILALWLAAAVVIAAAFSVVRRPWKRHEETPLRQRSERHEAMLAAWTEWLVDERLREILLRYHSGPKLAAFAGEMNDLSEEALVHRVADLLENRNLRRELAARLAIVLDIDRGILMRGLLDWREQAAFVPREA